METAALVYRVTSSNKAFLVYYSQSDALSFRSDTSTFSSVYFYLVLQKHAIFLNPTFSLILFTVNSQ